MDGVQAGRKVTSGGGSMLKVRVLMEVTSPLLEDILLRYSHRLTRSRCRMGNGNGQEDQSEPLGGRLKNQSGTDDGGGLSGSALPRKSASPTRLPSFPACSSPGLMASEEETPQRWCVSAEGSPALGTLSGTDPRASLSQPDTQGLRGPPVCWTGWRSPRLLP